MTIDIDAARRLTRAAVIGRVGKKLGTVAAVYSDDHTDEPEWVGVRTGADPRHRTSRAAPRTRGHRPEQGRQQQLTKRPRQPVSVPNEGVAR
jgi:hypothetical protein